jgi:hypothetical protein
LLLGTMPELIGNVDVANGVRGTQRWLESSPL